MALVQSICISTSKCFGSGWPKPSFMG
jgi:hypothetical protein